VQPPAPHPACALSSARMKRFNDRSQPSMATLFKKRAALETADNQCDSLLWFLQQHVLRLCFDIVRVTPSISTGCSSLACFTMLNAQPLSRDHAEVHYCLV